LPDNYCQTLVELNVLNQIIEQDMSSRLLTGAMVLACTVLAVIAFATQPYPWGVQGAETRLARGRWAVGEQLRSFSFWRDTENLLCVHHFFKFSAYSILCYVGWRDRERL